MVILEIETTAKAELKELEIEREIKIRQLKLSHYWLLISL